MAVLGVISHVCRQLSFGHDQDDLLLEMLEHLVDDTRLVRRVLEVGLGGQAMSLEKVGTVKKVSGRRWEVLDRNRCSLHVHFCANACLLGGLT